MNFMNFVETDGRPAKSGYAGLRRLAALVAALLAALGAPATAQPAPPPRPSLLVVISVDQLSADLFAQYRRHFTGGLARMLEGAVFPSGYQAHAATETCPGHATILTGAHPARSGIIANAWFDMDTAREDVQIYCTEDESVAGSTFANYTISPVHLLVPTLGDLMQEENSAARVVSIAGKDRSAVLLGGRRATYVFWPRGAGLTSYANAQPPAALTTINQLSAAMLAEPRAASAAPAVCAPLARPVAIGGGQSVGSHLFARAAGDVAEFRGSPDADALAIAFAVALVEELDLGRRETSDLLTLGLAATDYVGHDYGTQGVEMCVQLLALDALLGEFFAELDARGAPYAVALTADHGGQDLPERHVLQAAPDSMRIDPAIGRLGATLAAELGLPAPVLRGGPIGDIYVERSVPTERRAELLRLAAERLRAHPQIAAVYAKEELASTPLPTGPPESWSLLERVRASFHPDRSGDLVALPAPRVTPIADPVAAGYVATHGSPWDYDRRVPILFWQPGRPGFEQPLGVMTVDIMPTLAALIGLDISNREIDGRCLDLDPGEGTSCPP